jgi:tripartite-type tricarboxylate transporter receptor subunit TctC
MDSKDVGWAKARAQSPDAWAKSRARRAHASTAVKRFCPLYVFSNWRRAVLAAPVIGLFTQAAVAQDVERFYAGRKLSVVIGHEVGTGFDLYGRMLARHMGRFIPGNPTLVPENMIGVAGFAAANWLYNVAAKDGSVIAHFAHTAPFEPLLGKATGRFDATKFTWIGNMDAVVGVCGVWDHAGVTKFDDLFTRETIFGAGGAGTGGPLTQFPTALRRLLGVKIKLIQGYKGSAGIRLALMRGELQGICGIPVSTLKTEWKEDWSAGRFKILIQLGRERHPDLGDIPHVYHYTKTPEDRQVFDLIFGLQAIGRPFAAPPGIPAERVAALRSAFMAMTKDDRFRAEAAKLSLDVTPSTGEEVQEFVTRIYASPKAIVDRAKDALRLD